jgi:hypothetical protein
VKNKQKIVIAGLVPATHEHRFPAHSAFMDGRDNGPAKTG